MSGDTPYIIGPNDVPRPPSSPPKSAGEVQLSGEEQARFDHWREKINASLMAGNTSFMFPAGAPKGRRVSDALEQAYRAAGWQHVTWHFNRDSDIEWVVIHGKVDAK